MKWENILVTFQVPCIKWSSLHNVSTLRGQRCAFGFLSILELICYFRVHTKNNNLVVLNWQWWRMIRIEVFDWIANLFFSVIETRIHGRFGFWKVRLVKSFVGNSVFIAVCPSRLIATFVLSRIGLLWVEFEGVDLISH